MRPKRWLWRWRSNPVKRPSDVLEGAVLLVAVVLMIVGGPTVAVLSGLAAHELFREQRLARYAATAYLVDDAPARRSPAAYSSGADDRVRATIRWRDARNAEHTGITQVEPGRKAGSSVPVWLDGHGRLTGQPLGSTGGAAAATLVGGLAAAGWCAAVSAGVLGVRLGLKRRRARQWDREWAEVGPRWGHKHI
ncbi:Rv1733c family protein [Streptomyces sclerotialus]|uniref:Rv1733c family protein n=1 Tax=Streptomyces sclerotialus TaxID=1957 RepID=UPI0004C6C2F0